MEWGSDKHLWFYPSYHFVGDINSSIGTGANYLPLENAAATRYGAQRQVGFTRSILSASGVIRFRADKRYTNRHASHHRSVIPQGYRKLVQIAFEKLHAGSTK